MTQIFNRHFTTQQGFTLLEAMVALLIFSVGLLGLAGMQAAGIGQNKAALDRTVATQLSYDMAEQVRSNRAGYSAGNYNNLTNTTVTCDPCGSSDSIQAQQFRNWFTALSSELPSGQGRVTSGGPGLPVIITVFWDGDRTGATGTGCNPAVATDLRCTISTVLP